MLRNRSENTPVLASPRTGTNTCPDGRSRTVMLCDAKSPTAASSSAR